MRSTGLKFQELTVFSVNRVEELHIYIIWRWEGGGGEKEGKRGREREGERERVLLTVKYCFANKKIKTK